MMDSEILLGLWEFPTSIHVSRVRNGLESTSCFCCFPIKVMLVAFGLHPSLPFSSVCFLLMLFVCLNFTAVMLHFDLYFLDTHHSQLHSTFFILAVNCANSVQQLDPYPSSNTLFPFYTLPSLASLSPYIPLPPPLLFSDISIRTQITDHSGGLPRKDTGGQEQPNFTTNSISVIKRPFSLSANQVVPWGT